MHSELTDANAVIAWSSGPFYPFTRSEQDLDAALHEDGRLNRWFMDPIYGWQNPMEMRLDYVREGALPSINPTSSLMATSKRSSSPPIFTYKPREILIAENDASYSDDPDGEGRVRDTRRIAYPQSHIAAVHRAIEDVVPVTG